MKKIALNVFIVVLVIASLACIIWGVFYAKEQKSYGINDSTNLGDVNTITLSDSRAKVSFAEVILGKTQETRKLIVSEQSATVSTEISAQLIEKIDWDFLKKSQSVSYTGTGFFVVDLDKFAKEDLVDDARKKTLTIKISHAYLETISIDPEQIKIGKTQNGLLAQGKLKLTVSDFNEIEKEIQKRLTDKFNTVKNAQDADDIALKMVKEIYEPVVKAINNNYEVLVEFK